jgi:hypothetical protein
MSVEANNALALRDWEAWTRGNLAISDDDLCHRRRFP